MAFMGILFLNFLLIFIFGSTFIALILFIISMILFSKNKRNQKEGKKNIKNVNAIITLALSEIFFLPLIITIFVLSISSKIQNYKERAIIKSIENKVIVKKDEWKKGFKYNDTNLVPVNILMNSDNYNNSGAFKNLNKIGAIVMKNTNSYYSLYELDNDSGYKIYYVWVESFRGGEYYSRTFVDKNDYDYVLKYYNTSNLQISALWKTAPEDTKLRNVFESLNLNINNNRDELMELTHEVLDDVSNKKKVYTSSDDYDDNMEFKIKSADRVFTIDLVIYTKHNEMKLYLNGYEVEEKIAYKHKDMLFSLINDSQKELLNKANENSQN